VVPDLKTQKMTIKGFKKMKDFYKSVFDKITSKEGDVVYSTEYSFLKIFKETEDFLKKFWRKGKDNKMMNSTLYMASLMKIHQFCIKNLLLGLQKVDFKSYEVLKNTEYVFKEIFNLFLSKIKSKPTRLPLHFFNN
jgi:hypothetical protein